MSHTKKLHQITVPVLPESVSDAVLISWYKQVGEYIERDQPIVDIETDKVVMEVPSPVSGVLIEIIEPDGSTVTGLQILGTIDESEQISVGNSATKPAEISASDATPIEKPAIISPAAKKLIMDNNLSFDRLTGSGKDGRVLKEDVLNLVETKSQQIITPDSTAIEKHAPLTSSLTSPSTSPLASQKSPSAIQSASNEVAHSRKDTRVPMTRLRSVIAQRLLDAQHNAAILTTFNEVNMQAVMTLRNNYKVLFEKTYDVKLGFMSFFVKACVAALKQFPIINAAIDVNDIVYHDYYDIGVAVSSPGGLVVPVLRNAESLSMADIEQTIKSLAQKARDKQLSLDEIRGGSFSITNGGIFGSLLSTPILNPPQSAILGMHKIQDRPVVENGEIVIRPIMYVALSYDHRIIDGREAVQFLVSIKEFIEDPSRLLLEI